MGTLGLALGDAFISCIGYANKLQVAMVPFGSSWLANSHSCPSPAPPPAPLTRYLSLPLPAAWPDTTAMSERPPTTTMPRTVLGSTTLNHCFCDLPMSAPSAVKVVVEAPRVMCMWSPISCMWPSTSSTREWTTGCTAHAHICTHTHTHTNTHTQTHTHTHTHKHTQWTQMAEDGVLV